jgi:hypothetical protein
MTGRVGQGAGIIGVVGTGPATTALRRRSICSETGIVLLRHKFFVGVIPGRMRSTRAWNPYSRRRGYGSGLAASRRPGMTSDAVVIAALSAADGSP